MAQGAWKDAAEFYGKAFRLAPEFSFAAANQSLALYQQGEVKQAVRTMRCALCVGTSQTCRASLYAQCRTKSDTELLNVARNLLRRYPDFPDMRAALAAASWRAGDLAEAENNWARVDDPRYRDLQWLERWRRWPPQLRNDLRDFLALRATSSAEPQPT